MSPDVGDEEEYNELQGIDEIKRIGRRVINSNAQSVWCDNCSLPFCVDERGVRCRTIKGDCPRFYCQRETCILDPVSDRYTCSLCGNYSCELHGHQCAHPTCARAICQACECVCSVCGDIVCVVHMHFMPARDEVQVCVTCVERHYPKRLRH